MRMGFKKKKNIIIVSLCVIISFTLYQLYFFLTITSETDNGKIVSVNHLKIREFSPIRSEADKFVNSNGVLRGVLHSHMPKYRPNNNNQFKCLTVDESIPFEQVNDDYCDCEDGSDEPSTSACVNGTFYCDTQYRKSINLNLVPSSKVNDGICDCCDGSDEWLHHLRVLSQSSTAHHRHYVTECPNQCS